MAEFYSATVRLFDRFCGPVLLRDSKVGDRSGATAIEFMDDLRARLANRVQLTTDGHKAYLDAVEGAFGAMWTMPNW